MSACLSLASFQRLTILAFSHSLVLELAAAPCKLIMTVSEHIMAPFCTPTTLG